jgi:antitoxin (DNA-binding transcriptional repressor) of toxin-antitoxin stability system
MRSTPRIDLLYEVPTQLDRRGVVKDNHGMMQVSVEDIQQNLLIYLQRVEAGETLVIVRAGQPVVEMKPVKTGVEGLRPFGLCAGEFTVPEDFDAPLPEDLLQAFEGL